MFKRISFIVWFLINVAIIRADEGMWLPTYMVSLGDSTLQSIGFRISAEQIYSINHSSLKDAVVMFGRGCTGVFVSREGLLFTNHHCAYGSIQRLSSVDRDYITYGYWAKSREDELPVPGLTVSLLVKMEDVTPQLLGKMPQNLSGANKQAWIEEQIKNLTQQAIMNTHYKAVVKEFDYGNQYILMVYEVFEDVRLVGAPPRFIGAFGGDDDNWEWPRHSGDFSVFRVYADKNNRPAAYSPDNKPYRPAYVPSISLKGIQENDFVFVYGFPGQTQYYLTDEGIHLVAEKHNQIAIPLREIRLQTLQTFMQQNDTLFLLYTNQYAGIANYWKKMKGESWGIKRVQGIEKRKQEIGTYLDRITNPSFKAHFTRIKDSIQLLYLQYEPYFLARTYLYEGWFSVGAIRYASIWLEVYDMLKQGKTPSQLFSKVEAGWNNFQKQYRYEVEKAQLVNLLDKLKELKAYPGFSRLQTWNKLFNLKNYKNEFSNWLDQSFLFSPKFVNTFATISAKKAIHRFASDQFFSLLQELNQYGIWLDSLSKTYEIKLKEMYGEWVKLYYIAAEPNKRYPDANSTLRVAWGHVGGFQPRDAVYYHYFTTPNGVFEKMLNEREDYRVDTTFYRLLKSKDFGAYANSDGELVLCFRTNTHTTGGNSGSPVFNAKGELIGLNFDRSWEGTMSDLYYDENVCGNVVVDIRYCLWVIDKYAKARHLIDELEMAR